MEKINFALFHWNIITYCERKNAYAETIPAEWFILSGPYPTQEEAERIQAKIVEDTKGTDAEWPEADAMAKIVHDDDLGQYGLKPLNEKPELLTQGELLRAIFEETDEEEPTLAEIIDLS